MKTMFHSFGDIILVDFTFKTNVYNFLMTLFSGTSKEVKNMDIALAVVNNEEFSEIHGKKKPAVIITDQDQATEKSLGKVMRVVY